jgi:hypothetical protein
MGDQALVQVAGEHRDAVGASVVAEEVAGHAHLAAAAAEQHRLIEPGPVLDRLQAGGAQTGGRDGGRCDLSMRTSVLAEARGIAPGALSAALSQGRHRAAIKSQRPTAATPAAGSQGVTRRKGYASAALPHPCARVILLPSLPPGMGFFGSPLLGRLSRGLRWRWVPVARHAPLLFLGLMASLQGLSWGFSPASCGGKRSR